MDDVTALVLRLAAEAGMSGILFLVLYLILRNQREREAARESQRLQDAANEQIETKSRTQLDLALIEVIQKSGETLQTSLQAVTDGANANTDAMRQNSEQLKQFQMAFTARLDRSDTERVALVGQIMAQGEGQMALIQSLPASVESVITPMFRAVIDELGKLRTSHETTKAEIVDTVLRAGQNTSTIMSRLEALDGLFAERFQVVLARLGTLEGAILRCLEPSGASTATLTATAERGIGE